ncbi:MAG: DegT/DnrJ/EryC1/StrS family aminotransferase [Deltaproteobacteria bacterium]|nr:DegT/DnrJ/EryC1/StrS family aminotransferase [Deltaproteobacteria bacterium]
MSSRSQIPFLHLVSPHIEHEEEFVSVFRQALRTGRFIGGPAVDAFERDFSGFCGAKFCVGVGSGTDALRFALIASGIGRGEIVITAPNTFIATTEAITQAGGVPRFVDIDERTYNMDAEKLREYLEKECDRDVKTGRPVERRTRIRVSAIVPVHLYGQMADMDKITGLAGKYNLKIIEDACQAQGAEYFSKRENRHMRAGSIGMAAAFSFYPGKNLGACGEAGAVTTGDEEVARKIRMLRDHGQSEKYYHDIEGYNGRLDAVQAGILGIKLRYLDAWNQLRRSHAARYNELLGGLGQVILPHEPSWSKAVWHLYVIRVQDRAGLQKYLSENGIGTAIHYPVPLHRQKAYAGVESNGLNVADRVSGEILSLPMFPGLTEEQQERVVENIGEFALMQERRKASGSAE